MDYQMFPFDESHIFQQEMGQALALSIRSIGIAPQARKIGGQRMQPVAQLFIYCHAILLALLLVLLLSFLKSAQLPVPIGFQCVGHQPVSGSTRM